MEASEFFREFFNMEDYHMVSPPEYATIMFAEVYHERMLRKQKFCESEKRRDSARRRSCSIRQCERFDAAWCEMSDYASRQHALAINRAVMETMKEHQPREVRFSLDTKQMSDAIAKVIDRMSGMKEAGLIIHYNNNKINFAGCL